MNLINNKKPVELVQELENEIPSFEEFMKSYESDGTLNYDDLSGGSVGKVKGYGPCFGDPSYAGCRQADGESAFQSRSMGSSHADICDSADRARRFAGVDSAEQHAGLIVVDGDRLKPAELDPAPFSACIAKRCDPNEKPPIDTVAAAKTRFDLAWLS